MSDKFVEDVNSIAAFCRRLLGCQFVPPEPEYGAGHDITLNQDVHLLLHGNEVADLDVA